MVFEKSPFRVFGPFWLLFGLPGGPLGSLFGPNPSDTDWRKPLLDLQTSTKTIERIAKIDFGVFRVFVF